MQFCVDQCNPVDCGGGLQSYGRRRRDESGVVVRAGRAGGSGSSAQHSLVFDPNLGQQVLLSNTPLSREIYVETGTKASANNSTSDRSPLFRTPKIFIEKFGFRIFFFGNQPKVLMM